MRRGILSVCLMNAGEIEDMDASSTVPLAAIHRVKRNLLVVMGSS